MQDQGPRQTTMACSACFEVLADPRYLHMTVGCVKQLKKQQGSYGGSLYKCPMCNRDVIEAWNSRHTGGGGEGEEEGGGGGDITVAPPTPATAPARRPPLATAPRPSLKPPKSVYKRRLDDHQDLIGSSSRLVPENARDPRQLATEANVETNSKAQLSRGAKLTRNSVIMLCTILKSAGETSNRDAANELLKVMEKEKLKHSLDALTVEEENNIRRRCYDAVNCLDGLGIVTKHHHGRIAWNGIPTDIAARGAGAGAGGSGDDKGVGASPSPSISSAEELKKRETLAVLRQKRAHVSRVLEHKMAEASGLAMHLIHLRCLQHLNSQRHRKQQRNEKQQTPHEALNQPPKRPAPPAQQGSGALLPAQPPHAPSSDHSGMVSAPHQKRHKTCPFIQPPLIDTELTGLCSDVDKSTRSHCIAAPSTTAVPACVGPLLGAHTPSHAPPPAAGAASGASRAALGQNEAEGLERHASTFNDELEARTAREPVLRSSIGSLPGGSHGVVLRVKHDADAVQLSFQDSDAPGEWDWRGYLGLTGVVLRTDELSVELKHEDGSLIWWPYAAVVMGNASPPVAGSQETNAGGCEEEAAGDAGQSQGDRTGDRTEDDTGVRHRGDGLLDVWRAPSAPRSAVGQKGACDTEEAGQDEMRGVQGNKNSSGGGWCEEEDEGEMVHGDWSFIHRIRRQHLQEAGGGGGRGGGGGGGGGCGDHRAGGGQQGETREETEDEDRDSRQPTTFLHV